MSFAIPMPGASGRRRAGRPRHTADASTLSPRDQILDASGRLFVSHGFAATSTRDIAEAVGIRQASLYYYFAGKDEILAELLAMTVRPALDLVGELDHVESPEAALYLLAFHDATSLATLTHNIGMLPGCPDVSRSPEALAYAAARGELQDAYGSLGISCGSQAVIDTIDMLQLGGLILDNVESVIRTRTSGQAVTNKQLRGVADTSLRVCGVPQAQIEVAAKVAVTTVEASLTGAVRLELDASADRGHR